LPLMPDITGRRDKNPNDARHALDLSNTPSPPQQDSNQRSRQTASVARY
jgi:hypothetical protein